MAIVDSSRIGKVVSGIEVRFADRDLQDLRKSGVELALVAVGCTSSTPDRARIFNRVIELGYSLPRVVDPDALLMNDVIVGSGTVIMPNATVGVRSRIGSNCIINTGAIVDHDCTLLDNVHIAPGAALSGSVKVGVNSFIGVGAASCTT